MLDFFWHPSFVLVQASILSLSISLVISNKGFISIYNNSLFYKMTIVFLIFCSLIISFTELKWWIAIIYFILTFLIESTLANILTNLLVSLEYIHPTKLKLRSSLSDKISSMYILLNYIFMVILLILSIYNIIF